MARVVLALVVLVSAGRGLAFLVAVLAQSLIFVVLVGLVKSVQVVVSGVVVLPSGVRALLVQAVRFGCLGVGLIVVALLAVLLLVSLGVTALGVELVVVLRFVSPVLLFGAALVSMA